ncbi:MAG: hypothetical protein AAFW64_06280 [Pseudomonadota bacterium]
MLIGMGLGSLLLLATRPLRAQNGALQDTDVAPEITTALMSVLGITVCILAAWWVILRLARRQPRRLFAATITAWGVGSLLSWGPRAFDLATPETVAAFNRIALFGASITGLAILATGVIFVWTIFATLIDRL